MKIKVIKVGGAFLNEPEIAANFFAGLQQIQLKQPVVLVHGGGNAVQQLLTDLRLPSEKNDGLRVTPASQIDYVVGALAGTVNKKLCAQAQFSGLACVGLSLFDGNMTVSEKINLALGNVGSVQSGDKRLLISLLDQGFLPIISSIGTDSAGVLLNVNADQAAVVIAKLLDAQLILLSDVDGVLDGDKQLLPELNSDTIKQLIEQGVILDGMAVKVKAALDAANTIKQNVTIASWRNPDLFAQQAGTISVTGTTILADQPISNITKGSQ